MPSTNKKSNSKLLLQYAGLATQLLVLLAITIWAGMKLDKWLNFSTPILTWVLPLIAIVALMIKIIKETSKKS
jgi:Mn2+/Fe2+ NRAMP family transporter